MTLDSRRNVLRPPGYSLFQHLVLRGEAAVGEVGVEDAGGSYESVFVTRGEWFGLDGVAVMVI